MLRPCSHMPANIASRLDELHIVVHGEDLNGDGMYGGRTTALGAPLEADGPPALYATGRSRDTTGLWRSGDRGETWDLLSSAPAGRHQDISVLAGDPEVPGRIYVGFSGTGFVVGSPGTTSGPSTGEDSERTGEPDG